MPFSQIHEDNTKSPLIPHIVRRLGALFGLAERRQRTMPSQIKLEAVLASMTDAVVITDKSGQFIDFNEPFAHLNRFKTKSDCAIALAEYLPTFETTSPEGDPIPPDMWPIPRALRGESGVNLELKVRRADTSEQWTALYSYAPIRIEDGSIEGAVLIGRDITESRKSEAHLRSLSSRLHLALASAHLGVWEWDIEKNELSWDDRMFELYGIDREHFSTAVNTWETSIHPEDKEEAVNLLYASVRGEKAFDTQFRVVHPDGKVIHLKANGLVIRGPGGSPERMFGVNADITEQKLSEERLQRAYSEIEAKVIERTAQFEAAKVAAEDANRAKDHFLATLSHELRSPLSAILSWTQLMERGVLSPEKMILGIRTIKDSVWAQNQLIGDLLDLSRIRTGKLHIDRQPTAVADVLRDALDVIRPTAEQRNVRIEENFESSDIFISADPARLKQLLTTQGAIVRAEPSAKDALETFGKFKPDVVVSDIAMPEEDGHSLMRKIRALGHEYGGDTPAIALTAYAEPRDRDAAFASGFQEYLNKPADAGILATTILKLAERPGGVATPR